MPDRVPFVIVSRDEQWIFGTHAPPPGYEAAAGSSELGPVYRAAARTTPDGERAPFDPPHFFATAGRSGSASPILEIAAPELAPFPPSDWVTIFAHEYFHAYQFNDARWADDWSSARQGGALRERLRARWAGDATLRDSILRELDIDRRLLVAARGGARLGVSNLDELLAVRRARAAILDAEDSALAKAERALERVEGVARFIEESAYDAPASLAVLRVLDPSFAPPVPEKLLARRLAVSDGEYYYATGWALASLLDATTPKWRDRFAHRDLGELLREALSTK